jgi:hypothetical protein
MLVATVRHQKVWVLPAKELELVFAEDSLLEVTGQLHREEERENTRTYRLLS